MPSYYRDPRAPAPNRPLRVGAVALIERDGALLVERRAEDVAWGLIGGALEGDESISDAVRREEQEETGLATRSIELARLDLTPAHRAIVERYLGGPDGVVVE